jgi:alpha-1,3-glucosyltransferase
VDHVHFQYNGVLVGILLIALSDAAEGKPLRSLFAFTCLVNLKHLFVVLAPAIAVYLLRN